MVFSFHGPNNFGVEAKNISMLEVELHQKKLSVWSRNLMFELRFCSPAHGCPPQVLKTWGGCYFPTSQIHVSVHCVL